MRGIWARAIGIVAAVLLLPTSIALSQAIGVPKIGILALSEADSIEALLDSLRGLGWIDGKTVEIVFPKASPNPAKLEENMRALLAARVDIVVAQTKLAVLIAKRSTDSLPIVMGALNGDPVAEGFAGVVTVTGAEMFAIRKEIVAAQDKYLIPAVMGSIGYAEMGGLAKLGPEIPGLWRKMAPAVDQLLRGSAKPGDLPLVTLDGFELDINQRTAQALGLVVPPTMTTRATRIFK